MLSLECFAKAKELATKAELAVDEASRRTLRDMARHWITLGEQAEINERSFKKQVSK